MLALAMVPQLSLGFVLVPLGLSALLLRDLLAAMPTNKRILSPWRVLVDKILNEVARRSFSLIP